MTLNLHYCSVDKRTQRAKLENTSKFLGVFWGKVRFETTCGKKKLGKVSDIYLIYA